MSKPPPIPLDFTAGIDKAVSLAREVIDNGARVVAFGETYLGGYPLWLDEAPGAALWDHPGTRALHAIMLEQAVVANDERLLPLQELARRERGDHQHRRAMSGCGAASSTIR